MSGPIRGQDRPEQPGQRGRTAEAACFPDGVACAPLVAIRPRIRLMTPEQRRAYFSAAQRRYQDRKREKQYGAGNVAVMRALREAKGGGYLYGGYGDAGEPHGN